MEDFFTLIFVKGYLKERERERAIIKSQKELGFLLLLYPLCTDVLLLLYSLFLENNLSLNPFYSYQPAQPYLISLLSLSVSFFFSSCFIIYKLCERRAQEEMLSKKNVCHNIISSFY